MTDIIVAPFSNSDIRDWPADSYSALVGLLAHACPDDVVHVTGTRSQWSRVAEIVRAHDAGRVANDCGRWEWGELVARIRAASCVIGNNSGIAHISGYLGTPTVCVFGGSHQRLEWRPLGPHVVTLSRVIACSPCHLDHHGFCNYGKACLRDIAPEEVAEAAFRVMRDRAARQVLQEAL